MLPAGHRVVSAGMSGHPPTIRVARADDLDAIADLHTRSRNDYYRGFYPDEILADPDRAAQRRARWERSIESGEYTVLCAERDGGLAGIAVTGPEPEDPDPLVTAGVDLYVDPAGFRQGTGRALHTACLHLWEQAKVGRARIWVQDFNARGLAFWASQGWRLDGRRRQDLKTLIGLVLDVAPEETPAG